MRSFPYSSSPPMTTTAPTQPHMHHYHHHHHHHSLFSSNFFPIIILVLLFLVLLIHWILTRLQTMLIRHEDTNTSCHYSNDQLQTHVVHNLDELVINTIPFSVYTAKYANEESLRDCVICLDEFEDNNDIGTLPLCSHSFHLECIEAWLRKKPNCPLCRSSCHLNHSIIIDVPERSPLTPP